MLCSIVIPVFNRQVLVRKSLDSVANQTDVNWECIVVDDGSTDCTQQVVNEYIKRDNRFTLLQRNRFPKGAPTCRNLGLEAAKGNLVIFLDSDDQLSPTRVEESNYFFSNNPQHDAFIFLALMFESSACIPNLIDSRNSSDDLMNFIQGKLPWLTSCPTWRKSFLLRLGGWKEGMPKAQDWEFHVRALLMRPILSKGSTVGYYWNGVHDSQRIGHLPEDLEMQNLILEPIPNLLALCRSENFPLRYENAIFSDCFLYRLRKISFVVGILPALKALATHRGESFLRSHRYLVAVAVILLTGISRFISRIISGIAKTG